jgi:hypothetical protein
LLLTTTLRKRALSSIASLAASLRRRRDLRAASASPLELQMLLPLDEHGDESIEDTVGDDVLLATGLGDAADEERWIDALLTAADDAAASDAKAGTLIRLLKRIRRPALVFTEYRDTLEALRRRLEASGIAVCSLHGALSADERRRVLEEFASGGRTLIATDAAAEGLNLQSVCRVIVHYELPWNPARMLQRAGRVDRIGQRHRVHEIALVASDTAESLVLAPLARRAVGFSGGAGERMVRLLTESRVAALIFDGVAPSPMELPDRDDLQLTVDLSRDAEIEASRHRRREVLRVATLGRSERRRASIPVSTLGQSSLPAGLVLLFDIDTSASDRTVIERSTLAVHVEMALPSWPERPREITRSLEQLLPALRVVVSPILETAGHRQLQAIRYRYEEAAHRMHGRTVAIRQNQESVARRLVQAGLFERRARRDGPPEADGFELGGRTEETASNALTSSADLRAVLIVRPR